MKVEGEMSKYVSLEVEKREYVTLPETEGRHAGFIISGMAGGRESEGSAWKY